ncbi:MAG: cytochrome c [Candidatus Rokubacteria bacterium]|nr:cytochrome c [Candidatus Rokubacteria bacterium]
MVKTRTWILITAVLLPTVAQANGEKGKTLYGKYCVACHGESGKGDGPAGAALKPKPRDLTDKAYMDSVKDEYLAAIIQKGGPAVGKSALMPAWGAMLKDDDVRDVVEFIKGLAK